jgi:acetylglutamate kinase
VLDADGKTIAELGPQSERELAAAGTVNRGMLAKLRACRAALAGGVPDVAIVDGRDPARLRAVLAGADGAAAWMTRVK